MPISPAVRELKIEINILHQIIDSIAASENLDTFVQQAARVLAENLKGDSCLIYLVSPDALSLTLSGAWPPHPGHIGKLTLGSGEGLTGWVAAHRTPVAIARKFYRDARAKVFQNLPEDRYEAFLSVPVISEGAPIGVINIQNRRPRIFSKSQIRLLSSIASQISVAIARARLRELHERKSLQLQTLAKLANSIVSPSYLNEILQLIVSLAAQTMNSKICSLLLLDEKTQEFSIAATQSLSDEYRRKPPVKLVQSISGRVLRERKPLAVLDVTREPGYGYPDIARKEGLRSMLAVPMLVKDRPIGVLACYTTTEHAFTVEEIEILQTIANQSAIAIENTRLIEESRSTREALETRKNIERAKGALMRARGISEEEAFQFIQRQAMNLRRTMREVAEAILLSDGLRSVKDARS